MATETKAKVTGGQEGEPAPLFIVDLGEQSHKRLKKLKKGKGKLLTKINNVMEKVAADESLPKGATPVFLVKKGPRSLKEFFQDDDD